MGVAVPASASAAKQCLENRGALDIGSGTTKFLVLRIDVCKKQVVEVLFQDRLALAFNEALEKSSDKKIPDEFSSASAGKIESVLEKMKGQDVKKISAVATAVFRNAKNGAEVINSFSKRWKIPIRLISQQEEAELGFWSVLAEKSWKPEEASVVIWDIGGGSMQMYAWNRGRPQTYQGQLASVSFKNEVLKTLFFKAPDQEASPNPLGDRAAASVQIAKNHAVLNVPEYFKKHGAKADWVGVGGVLSLSVQGQTKKNAAEFSQSELAQALTSQAKLSDEQIQSEYKTTDVTNLALVLGYMKALDIKSLHTVKSSLGQGLIYRELLR